MSDRTILALIIVPAILVLVILAPIAMNGQHHVSESDIVAVAPIPIPVPVTTDKPEHRQVPVSVATSPIVPTSSPASPPSSLGMTYAEVMKGTENVVPVMKNTLKPDVGGGGTVRMYQGNSVSGELLVTMIGSSDKDDIGLVQINWSGKNATEFSQALCPIVNNVVHNKDFSGWMLSSMKDFRTHPDKSYKRRFDDRFVEMGQFIGTFEISVRQVLPSDPPNPVIPEQHLTWKDVDHLIRGLSSDHVEVISKSFGEDRGTQWMVGGKHIWCQFDDNRNLKHFECDWIRPGTSADARPQAVDDGTIINAMPMWVTTKRVSGGLPEFLKFIDEEKSQK